MRFCGNCGAEVEEDLAFCSECGSPIDDVDVDENQQEEDNSIINDSNSTDNLLMKKKRHTFYIVCVMIVVVGLFALVIGVYGIVVLRDMSVSVISLISGSISELISGTIFWVHNKSALQLNHYYNALHENEKFLSAVNIADKLCDEKKEAILIEIIRKQIGDNKSVDLK